MTENRSLDVRNTKVTQELLIYDVNSVACLQYDITDIDSTKRPFKISLYTFFLENAMGSHTNDQQKQEIPYCGLLFTHHKIYP